MTDQEHVKAVREAAQALTMALESASRTGLIFECSFATQCSSWEGTRLVKQSMWWSHVAAKREIMF